MENGVIEFRDWLFNYCDEEMIDTGDFDCFFAFLMYLIEEEYGSFTEAFAQAIADADSTEDAYRIIYDEFEVQCTYSNNEFESNVGDYMVFDDYDDAKEMAIKYNESFVVASGIPEDYLDDPDFVDTDWFDDAMKEYYEDYCREIASESSYEYENRLVEECYDADLIDDTDFEEDEYGDILYTACVVPEDELIDRLANSMCEDYGSGAQWYIDNFGTRNFREVCEEHNLYNARAFAEFAVDTDGPANALAGYDGYEIEFDLEDKTYWMYRTN